MKLFKKKELPTGISWKKILFEIYNFAPSGYGESLTSNRNSDNHSLAKKLKITGQELMMGIDFLENNQLVELKRQDMDGKFQMWVLTEKGFNVARDLQREMSNAFQQVTIIFLTFVLALTAIFDFISRLQNNNKTLFIWLYIGSIILTMLTSYFIFKKSTK